MSTLLLFSRSFFLASNGRRQLSNIGFIGLGNMGGHMARNLIKKGYKLTVFDVNGAAVSSLVEAGANGANSAADASENADVVISMLPSNQHVLDCYIGEKGVLSSVKKDVLLVDSSTIDPSVSEQVSIAAKKIGARFVDAPVSGGVNAASAATLTLMVGGSKTDFEDAERVLAAVGSRVIHCGKVGAGQATKLCNNMLLGISMIGTAEAFILGERLGLDPKILASVINTSSGRCWSSELYNPVPGVLDNAPSTNGYKGGFGTALMTKDLGLAQAAASRTETPSPLGSIAYQIYRTAMGHGHSKLDFSVVYQFLKGKQ
ncbi:3-hydroxyisobutyrate dehydrogenase, mitochondrial [Diprion similis]|uniref:3-hydroxyisobutyrate dehydrogenase, mitochondrial n=1 Tax=Diprion similis TaxID=362088 RepID=UPI001EF95953|nr:3-hydroxyisobutyrate dehydrogenase, mitochondrial [Diprion similis]XP_046735792.1 3-hydroxyisobutyrate dehydrogenase, mitochondrial [Diprion similis]